MNQLKNKEEVFEELYARYRDMLFRICMSYLGNIADTEDIMQEAFIRLLYKSPCFKSKEHEKYWLIRITLNLCKNLLKHNRKSQDIYNDTLKYIHIETEPSPSAEQTILEMISSLSEKQRIVMYLYYYERYSIQEIAKLLSLSKSAVKMRLKRAREQLKLDLEVDL